MASFPDDDVPEVTYSYTRSQAIEDGVLVVAPSQLCKEAGIRYPVAFTRTLWDSVIAPDEASKAAGQSTTGRLWDVLFLLAVSARRCSGPSMLFVVRFLFKGDQHRDIELKSLCGPGDDAEPVLTVMYPFED